MRIFQHLPSLDGRGAKGRVMTKKFYTHSVEGKPVDEWHRLAEHLKGHG